MSIPTTDGIKPIDEVILGRPLQRIKRTSIALASDTVLAPNEMLRLEVLMAGDKAVAAGATPGTIVHLLPESPSATTRVLTDRGEEDLMAIDLGFVWCIQQGPADPTEYRERKLEYEMKKRVIGPGVSAPKVPSGMPETFSLKR